MPINQSSLLKYFNPSSATSQIAAEYEQDHQENLTPHHLVSLSNINQYCPQDGIKERKVNKMPYKVLDAPNIHEDFYLNLVDWSSTNVLAVGLQGEAYVWSASTC
jgi:cell division cycle 20-like protein 1 (cofactor of APC complex)